MKDGSKKKSESGSHFWMRGGLCGNIGRPSGLVMMYSFFSGRIFSRITV